MRSITERTANEIYPTPLIRGERITRLGEKCLGRKVLDAETGLALGMENIGWLVAGLPSFERMVSHIERLNESAKGGHWIVVPATNRLAELAFEQWFSDGSPDQTCASPTLWRNDLVTFCIPEQLETLMSMPPVSDSPIAGIILLDPQCFVHSGRSFTRGNRRMVHDRPQMIVDFRASRAVGDWQPPFIHMTCKRAGAVPTDSVARIFCIESYHCIDGNTLGCGLMWGQRPENLHGGYSSEYSMTIAI
jgi:hypothetical protein